MGSASYDLRTSRSDWVAVAQDSLPLLLLANTVSSLSLVRKSVNHERSMWTYQNWSLNHSVHLTGWEHCKRIFLEYSKKILAHWRENIDIVRDVIILHCCSARLLSAQNQQVAYKLASQEYLGCARDQPMPGPFPAFPPHPFFKGKALGTRLGRRTWSPGLSPLGRRTSSPGLKKEKFK